MQIAQLRPQKLAQEAIDLPPMMLLSRDLVSIEPLLETFHRFPLSATYDSQRFVSVGPCFMFSQACDDRWYLLRIDAKQLRSDTAVLAQWPCCLQEYDLILRRPQQDLQRCHALVDLE